MSERGKIDPEERAELESRAEVDPAGGAIRGDVPSDDQANSWESAKIGLRDEPPGGSGAQESRHGDVLAVTPEGLTGLEQGEVMRTAAGLTAVKVAMKYALAELGVVDGARMLAKLNQPDG